MAGDGLALHVTGDGAAVLFLHAFPLDASQWDHQVAALSGAYRCIRPDVWGCGSSPPPPAGAPSLDALAASILTALDARGVERFDVVGLSMGGYLAFALHRAAPQRISAMALCNTRAGADTDQARADRVRMADEVERANDVEPIVEPMLERLVGPRAREEPHIIDPLLARMRRCTPAGVAWAQRAMAARPDSTPHLRSITVPVLCIAGEDDALTPPRELEQLAAAIDGARLVTLSCGHLSNLEVPHDVSRALEEFLDSIPR